MKSQLSWDSFFMGFAWKVSELSYEEKTKVGSIIVRDGNILSFSYNGTPPGLSNEMRDHEGNTLDTVLHAESNAILKMAKEGVSTIGATIYTTRQPCIDCAKLIYQAGLSRVVYNDNHSDNRGTDFLRMVNVCVIKQQG